MDDNNHAMQNLLMGLVWARDNARTEAEYDSWDWLIDEWERAKITFEDLIEQAKNIGTRNPAFDGDMVGWLPDDFDEDDEDDFA